MIDTGLVLSRFLHYAATTTLFGASLFPLYVCADPEPEEAGFWRRRMLLLTANLALFSALLWFVFSAANMIGSVSDLADEEALWAVVHDTGFGVIWTGRVMLAAIMIILLMAIRPLPRRASGRISRFRFLLQFCWPRWRELGTPRSRRVGQVLFTCCPMLRTFSPPVRGWEGSFLSLISSLITQKSGAEAYRSIGFC
jgi:hypothetical protein